MKPIVNINEVSLEHSEKGKLYEEAFCSFGEQIGARFLGYGVSIVPPGKRACPFHSHHVNEEMFFIIEGKGKLRFGDEVYALKAGDVIACPPGGPEVAHQIINDSDSHLKYLSVSTMTEADFCEYPDSGKFGAFAPFVTIDGKETRRIRFLGRAENTLDYWDGEEID
jgi:uncharacterized cupin superfamily protein